jgi:hypothetical protein
VKGGMNNGTQLTDRQIQILYKKLLSLADTCTNPEFGKNDRMSAIFQTYALSTASGVQIYQGITDAQLTEVMIRMAEKLNHSPSQKEIFWVLREYIKRRFRRWPYALTAAGLDKLAGKSGKPLEQVKREKREYARLLAGVREKAMELGRIPHPKDMPETCAAVKKYVHSWRDVVRAAGIDQEFFIKNHVLYKIDHLEAPYSADLKTLRTYAEQIGRAPLRSEVNPVVKDRLIRRCGSWRNALYQVDLEPVISIVPFAKSYLDHRRQYTRKKHESVLRNCLYKVLHLDDELQKDLQYVKRLAEELNRVPVSNDIHPEMRRRLLAACGSWPNVLFQIGLSVGKNHVQN